MYIEMEDSLKSGDLKPMKYVNATKRLTNYFYNKKLPLNARYVVQILKAPDVITKEYLKQDPWRCGTQYHYTAGRLRRIVAYREKHEVH